MNRDMSEHLLHDDRQLQQNLQKKFRDLSKNIRSFDRDLNKIGTSTDTVEWRGGLRKRIDSTTHNCKTLHQELVRMEQNDPNNFQAEKLKKQFTKEIDKLKEVVQKINVKEREYKPRGGSTSVSQNNPNESMY